MKHPDYVLLAKIVSAVDERADSGEPMEDIYQSIIGRAVRDDFFDIAKEISLLIKTVDEECYGLGDAMPIAWVGGFSDGAFKTKGVEPSVADMYSGADPKAVFDVAMQRVIRIPNELVASGPFAALCSLYVDGYIAGVQYTNQPKE